MQGEFYAKPTGRRDGRRFDTWTYRSDQHGTIEVEVMFHSDKDGVRFVASSTHPLLKGVQWESSDIDKLMTDTCEGIEAIIEARNSIEWARGWVVESSYYDSASHMSRRVHFEVELTPVSVRRGDEMRNDAERRVIRNGRTTTIREQDGADKPPVLAHGDKIFRTEQPKGRSVLLSSPAVDGALLQLQETLRSFGIKFSSSIGPSQVRRHGIPDKARLMNLLDEAWTEAEAAVARKSGDLAGNGRKQAAPIIEIGD